MSGGAVTLDETEAHLQALLQAARKEPPNWANHDLTFGQLRLLFTLRQCGPVPIGQLAEMLSVTAATASEFVDRLERRGLATRSHRLDDRRVVECRLSDAGARLLADVVGARRQVVRQALSLLTQEELADFDRLLKLMADRLAAVSPSPA